MVSGIEKINYPSDQISSVSAEVEKVRKFGFVGFFIGAILLSVILGSILNVLGVIIGIIIAAVGSYYTVKVNIVNLKFADGKTVKLECSNREVKKLVKLGG